jgi:hypothetical protein
MQAAMELTAIGGMCQGDVLKPKYEDLTETGAPLSKGKQKEIIF